MITAVPDVDCRDFVLVDNSLSAVTRLAVCMFL